MVKNSHFVYRFGGRDLAYHEFTLGKSYVYLCSTLTMRGWSILPSNPAAQLAILSLLFFGTLMFWHWEAMLVSYLAARIIVMPFTNMAELMSNTEFRIILIPSTSFESAFKFSKNPDWQAAWIDRVQPHLEEHRGFGIKELTGKVATEDGSAVYDNYFSVM